MSEWIIWVMAAGCLLAGGGLLAFGKRRSDTEEFFRRAGFEAVGDPRGEGALTGRAGLRTFDPLRWLERAGWLSSERDGMRRGLAYAPFVFVIAAAALGMWTLSLLAAAAIVMVFALAWKKARARRESLKDEIPGVLDSLIRGLEVGLTLDTAFRMTVDSSSGLIKTVLQRVRTRVELGESLGEAFRHAARVQGCRELHLLGFILDMHQQHGGKASEMLGGLAQMITVDQQIRRDVRALTAETRFTALVLIMLPLGMAVYLLATNPDYLMRMWEHESGAWVLVLAAAMQVVGSALIWRLSNPRIA
ncbi:type II secretion system F family protein [Guyparkeria hydrothermalis]|uniref:type II secretion system F family protein n=1 Tax=Guyparkeria hydrothermalis TaxID=923 RepID=UPI0020211985|nr:type II secretion system F family protein [Guyparkeria hydrothermalis]MCL7743708.1 type II secretion system F family protein [Guyparkeria hydrothermalis]